MTGDAVNDGESTSQTAPDEDRRRHSRVEVALKARFMTLAGGEHPCLVANISAGGALLRAKIPPKIGDVVILYVDRLGRFEGEVVRAGLNSFAMSYASGRNRARKIADNLTKIINEPTPVNDRRETPRVPGERFAAVELQDGARADCSILDMSLTGASIEINPRPELGAKIRLGKMNAKVVRRHEKGVGVVFTGPADGMDDVLSQTTKPNGDGATNIAAHGAEIARTFGRKGADV